MTTEQLREKTKAELQQELLALRKEQFNLRMRQSMDENARPHLVKNVRRNIARVKTIMTEKAKDE